MNFNEVSRANIQAHMVEAKNNSDECYAMRERLVAPLNLIAKYQKECKRATGDFSEDYHRYSKILRAAREVLNTLAHMEADFAADLKLILRSENDDDLAADLESEGIFETYKDIINPIK